MLSRNGMPDKLSRMRKGANVHRCCRTCQVHWLLYQSRNDVYVGCVTKLRPKHSLAHLLIRREPGLSVTNLRKVNERKVRKGWTLCSIQINIAKNILHKLKGINTLHKCQTQPCHFLACDAIMASSRRKSWLPQLKNHICYEAPVPLDLANEIFLIFFLCHWHSKIKFQPGSVPSSHSGHWAGQILATFLGVLATVIAVLYLAFLMNCGACIAYSATSMQCCIIRKTFVASLWKDGSFRCFMDSLGFDFKDACCASLKATRCWTCFSRDTSLFFYVIVIITALHSDHIHVFASLLWNLACTLF